MWTQRCGDADTRVGTSGGVATTALLNVFPRPASGAWNGCLGFAGKDGAAEDGDRERGSFPEFGKQ
jgi:hypothetical protein